MRSASCVLVVVMGLLVLMPNAVCGDAASDLVDAKLELLKQELKSKGIDSAVLDAKLGGGEGSGSVSLSDSQKDAAKESFSKKLTPHFDGLERLGDLMNKEIEKQQDALGKVDAAMQKVDEVMNEMASRSQRFAQDLEKLGDIVSKVQMMSEGIAATQQVVKDDLYVTHETVRKFTKKSSSRGVWYLLLIVEVLAVIGFVYWRKMRADKKFAKLV